MGGSRNMAASPAADQDSLLASIARLGSAGSSRKPGGSPVFNPLGAPKHLAETSPLAIDGAGSRLRASDMYSTPNKRSGGYSIDPRGQGMRTGDPRSVEAQVGAGSLYPASGRPFTRADGR